MYKAGSQVKAIVAKYKATLQKCGIKVDRIILYGSFAQGREREHSDIDLVVVSENFQKMNLRERLEVLGMAAARIMQPIEAKGYTAEEIKSVSNISFLSEILKAGVNV